MFQNKLRPLHRVMTLTMVLACCAFMASPRAMASESRGYVVEWFYHAAYSDGDHCADGFNLDADDLFDRILREDLGKSTDEIEVLMDDFPNTMYGLAGNRGRINGEPTDVYLNPTSVPDPNIPMASGKQSAGFNLDGEVSPDDFVDAETGETGIDNQLHRAIGCTRSLEGTRTRLPTLPSITWDMLRDHQKAWLVEISGIDDFQNDDEVMVGFHQSPQQVMRGADSEPIRDMTFSIDPDPRTTHQVQGKIVNGVLTTDVFHFFMIGDPFSTVEYDLRRARMRFTFDEDGSLHGLVGGYQSWETLYVGWALPGVTNEVNVSLDVPGLYYALRKTADADPDPETGMNMSISASYFIEAIPAYIAHDDNGLQASSSSR
jgi:hypothetical protein